MTERRVCCVHCVFRVTKDMDAFCADDVGTKTAKCVYCIKARKGNRLGGCIDIDMDDTKIKERWELFVQARAAARRDRVAPDVFKAFRSAGALLREAIGEVQSQGTGRKRVEKAADAVISDGDDDGDDDGAGDADDDGNRGENDANSSVDSPLTDFPTPETGDDE